jgi:hypothetical protein
MRVASEYCIKVIALHSIDNSQIWRMRYTNSEIALSGFACN